MGGRGAVRGHPPPTDTQTMIQHLAGLVRNVPVRQSETSLLPTTQRILDGDIRFISPHDRKHVTAALPIYNALGNIYHTVRDGKRVSKRTRKFMETIHAIEVVSAEGLLRTTWGDFHHQLEIKLQQSERHVRKVTKRGRIARLFKSKRDKEKFDTLEAELNLLFDGVTLKERRSDVRKAVEDINENLKNVALDRDRQNANEETRVEIHEPIREADEGAKNDGMGAILEDSSEHLVFAFEGEELSEELSAILCPPSEDSSLSLVGERIRMGRLRGIVERNLKNFHPDTRQWLHDEVSFWCHEKNNSKSFVLAGPSGIGKSCAVASICNRFAKDGNLVACYFPENPSLQQPKTFVVNLASQLSHSVPGYNRVLEQDNELRADLRHLSAVEMYQRLIHRPLCCVRRPDATKRMLVVLDDCDELVNSSGGEEIRVIINQMRNLPSWLAILITCGENTSPIKRYFKQSELEPDLTRVNHEDTRVSSEVLRLSNEDPRNQEDIRRFLADVLGQTMSASNVHQVIEILLDKSEGKLSYFHFVNFVVEHDNLTNKTLNKLPTGLSKVLGAIVDSVYTFLGPNLYSALLGCLTAAKEPVHKDILGSIMMEENVNAAFQKQAFAQLGKMTRCKCESLSLATGMKSWLTTTESKHRIDVGQGHAVLARISKESVQNIMAEMRGDDVRPTSGATARYAIRYGMHHCILGQQFGSDFMSLFCNIHYVRVRLETDPLSVYDMVEEYTAASGSESLSTEGRATTDRFRNLLLRHADSIVDNAESFVPIAANDSRLGSDRQVASSYLDRKGRPWLQKVTEQPQCLAAVTSFTTRAAAILDCDVTPDEKLFACGDSQGKVRVFRSFTGKIIGLFETDFPEIRQCTFLPDGKNIFFGSSTHVLNIEGELVPFEPLPFPGSMTTPTTCAFTNDGSKIAMFLNVDYSLSGVSLSDLPEDIFKVKIFDLQGETSSTGSNQLLLKSCSSLSDHQAPIQCCCFVDNGSSVVVGCRDKSLNVWDVQTGQKLRKINFDGGLKNIFTRGSLLCVVGDKCDTSVRVLDLDSTEEVGIVENHHGGVSSCHVTDDYVISACRGRNHETDQNGRLYLTSSRSLKVNKVFVADSSYISCCATKVGCVWVCGEDGRVSLVKLEEENSTSNVNQDSRPHGIATCAFSPNSKELVTCEHGENGTLTIWDAQKGDLKRGLCYNKGRYISKIEMKKVESKCPPRCIFSSDGARLVALAGTNSLQVWDLRRERHRLLKGHAYFRITCMALSTDNAMVAAGSTDTTLCVWDIGANFEDKKRIEGVIFEGHSDGVSCCAFSPDSQTLASGDRAGKLILWSPGNAEPKVVCKGHRDVITCLSFSVDSCHIASGGKDGNLGVWDVESGDRLLSLKADNANCVTSCEFSPSGLILSSETSGIIRAWNATNGSQVCAFKLTESSVLSSRFIREGKYIASVSQDGVLSVLETTTGRTVSQCRLPSIPACMDVSRDHRFVTCGLQHGGFVLYKLMNI